MSDLVWTQKLSVGDDAIDSDHKELFKLVNDFETADVTDHVMADVLSQLEHYAAVHFAREEEYMRSIGYPEIDAHIREHKNFVEWLVSVRHAYHTTPATKFYVGQQVNEFLEKWLVNHIMHEDKKYGDFAVQEGKA